MSIDTLQISKELIKAGLEQDVAENLALHFKRQEEEFISKKEAEERLATKKDISKIELKIEKLNTAISDSKLSIIKWVAAMMVGQSGIIIGAIIAINH